MDGAQADSEKPQPGLLNSALDAPPVSGQLKQIAEKVEASVKPEMRETYDRIVAAGMQAMWGDDATHNMMVEYLQTVKQDPSQLVKVVAHGVIKLVSIVLNQSGLSKEEFMGPSAPAALLFMTQVLEYLQKKMGLPIDASVIDQTTKAVAQGLFELYDVTPEQIDEAMTQQGKSPSDGGMIQQPPPSQPEPTQEGT